MVGRQAVGLEQAPTYGREPVTTRDGAALPRPSGAGVPDEVIDPPAGYFPVPATSQLDGPALGSRARWQLTLLES